MVNVNLKWVITARNTGIAHDLTCGCSLLDPDSGEELVMLPWWNCPNVPTGNGFQVTLTASGDIAAGTYLAKARAWQNHSGGTKIGDLDSVGSVYAAGSGVLTGILDEATQTLVISGGAVISADIESFSILTI